MTDQRSYDDRDGLIWFDGEMVPWREANVHVLTHALHYASSVFEGQRAYSGEIFRLTDHSKRLKKSGELLGFDIPWSVEEIDQACRDVLAASGMDDCYMRPLAWRGSEQMGVSAQKSKIHLAIAAWPWGAYFGEDAIMKGLRLDISPWRRPAPYTAPVESKASGLYMICTLARHQAQARGFDDALMFDWRGQVAEGTGANAFFVKEGKLFTPTPDCFLNGITRQTVIELAQRRGIEVIEKAIWPEELEGFEQFFLTGSAAEVTPVASAGPWSFEVGEMTRQLRKDYLDLAHRRISNS
ncbi:MAG TPA: branched-chain amino acid aminotransferase [Allosphingosinicella sp.]